MPLGETMGTSAFPMLAIDSWYLKIWMKTDRLVGNNSLGNVRNWKKWP